MSYLIDTNICIALLKKNDHALVDKIHSFNPANIFLCSVVKAELVYGARLSQKVDENLRVLKIFFEQFDSFPFDDQAIDHYGIIRTSLKKVGTPIGANDMLIAATALAYDLTLVTRNRNEFVRVPNLRLEYW